MEKTEETTNRNLVDAIKSMGSLSQEKRSKIGIVRSLFSAIEHARGIGYSLESILKALKENGFDDETTLGQFYDLTYRIRVEQGLVGKKRVGSTFVVQTVKQESSEQKIEPSSTEKKNETKSAIQHAPIDKQQMISMVGIGRKRNEFKPQKPD